MILAQEIIWRVQAIWAVQNGALLPQLWLSAEGRGVLCVHGHRAVQPVEFHHTDHCCAQEGALESPLGQGKAGWAARCPGSCQRHKQQIKLSLSPIMWPAREPSPALQTGAMGSVDDADTLQLCLAWRPAEGHVCSWTTTQMPPLRSWEWQNALNVTEIHSIHSVRASSSAFFACDKNIAWILPENIWPATLRGLFKERGSFCSGHQLFLIVISQHLEKEQGKAPSSAGSVASPGQMWHLCEHLGAQREHSFPPQNFCAQHTELHSRQHLASVLAWN